ncbi:hypothetical protein [Roseomonas sp. WA12]
MKRSAMLSLGFLLAAAWPVGAQVPVVEGAPAEQTAPMQVTPEQVTPAQTVTLALEAPGGGSAREYQVDDVSVSVTRSMDARGDSRADVMVSLGAIRPIDTFLLEWARQGEVGPDAARKAVVTMTAPQASGAAVVTRYEMEGAKVLAFTASHSAAAGVAQVMVQVSVRRIALNGVVLN